jgi:hypothetical protein
MTLKLNGPVGKDATNAYRDVKLVQILINLFSAWKTPVTTLKTDGRYGKNTRNAIEAFQKQAVKMHKPDARIDVDGKTFRYLTMYLTAIQQTQIKEALLSNQPIKPIVDKKLINKQIGTNHLIVTYKKNLPQSERIVSNYSIEVIKMALKESGMTHAVITSTIRTPHEQASIMYAKALDDYKSQIDLYGRNGDAVLKVFKANKSKPKDEVINLMIDKINDLAKSKRRVSKHVVSKESYLKENIIDIGTASTSKVSKNYNIKKFTKALEGLVKEGYIKKFIDETKITNKAWHIEIKVGSKPLINDIDASILSITRWC